MSIDKRRRLATETHPRLSLSKRCRILNINRSGIYYKSKKENALNDKLMRIIDKKFMDHPYYGVERMTDFLRLDLNFKINIKRVRRLYEIMNLKTLYARPKTTQKDPSKYVYPYLLRNLEVVRPNQVWQTDITYIPMFRGFMYLAAIIDVYSRKIVGWSVSNTMTKEWCIELLKNTIARHGAPEIHNSDQGVQYTSSDFINVLKDNNIKISMDGRRRTLDNIYIERFWRSIKQEKIYLNPPNGGVDLRNKVKEYMTFYNNERRHTEIGKVPPNVLYFEKNVAS